MKNQYIKMVAVAVIAALIAYGFGVKHGEGISQTNPGNQNRIGQFGGRTGGARGMGGGITAGQVISKDSTSLTLQLRNGGSINVLYSTSTQVQKTASGTISNITTGTQVTVSGSLNADGSISAQNIQIRPEMNASSSASFGR